MFWIDWREYNNRSFRSLKRVHGAHCERLFIRARTDTLFTQRLFDSGYLRAKRRHDTDNFMKRFAVMRFNILLVLCQPGRYRFSLKQIISTSTTCLLSFTINMEITHCGH